jgi:HK97 family phage portal protein
MNLWPFSRKSTTAMSSSVFHELLQLVSGGATKSGATVNAQTALEVETVLACVRVVSEGIAQVPLKVFKSDGKNRQPAPDHPLYDKLHRKPNPWMSSFEMRETMGIHAALTGQAFAFKNRVSSGRIGELIPIEPGRVTVQRADDWTLTYIVRGDSGAERPFPAEAIWHWRGPSWNGYTGLEIVRLAREAIGLAMASEESQAKMHQRGLRPSGLYSVDGTLNPAQYADLRKWLEGEYGGAANAARVMLLDRSAKFTPLSQTGVDAQHLETRRHQILAICSALRVQPIMIGFGDKAQTFASAEQMFLAHVVHTLGPWYERIEQSADIHLLTDAERAQGYYVKHITAGLLRGAMKDRADYFAKALGSGGSPAWMTQDEVRDLDELNPMGGTAAALAVATNVPSATKPPAA